jgi:hypothetical protein
MEAIAKTNMSLYEAYVGSYRFDDGFTMRISRDGDKLLFQFPGDENKT